MKGISFSILFTFATLFLIWLLILNIGINVIPSFGLASNVDNATKTQVVSEAINATVQHTIKKLPPLSTKIVLESSPQPPALTESETLDALAQIQEVNKIPDIPTSIKNITGPVNGTEINVNKTNLNVQNTIIKKASITLTSDRPSLNVRTNHTLTPLNTAYVMETSVANKDKLVFYTGNWFAARSTDGGVTWTYINPSDVVMGDFCCDQDIIYDPHHQMFIWYLQGREDKSTGENRIQIGVSNDTKSWWFGTYRATDINSTWTHQNSDYPHIALGDNYLYVTMNMYKQDQLTKKSQFLQPLILRISLNDLAESVTKDKPIMPSFDYYYDPSGIFTFTPIQGAKETMYWAAHVSNARMRIYQWNESLSQASIKTFNRDIPAWTPLVRGHGTCLGPDGNDWCGRGQSKIRSGFITKNIIGFLWEADKGGKSANNATFTYPYVDAATFKINNNISYIGRPYLWSPDFAWMYAFASPDKNGNVAIESFFGGGDFNPSLSVGIGNNFNGSSLPWNMKQLVNSTNGPTPFLPFVTRTDLWGDFIRMRPFNGDGPGWIGSGWTLQGGSQMINLQPRYFEFDLVGSNTTVTTKPISSTTINTSHTITSGLGTNVLLLKNLKKR